MASQLDSIKKLFSTFPAPTTHSIFAGVPGSRIYIYIYTHLPPLRSRTLQVANKDVPNFFGQKFAPSPRAVNYLNVVNRGVSKAAHTTHTHTRRPVNTRGGTMHLRNFPRPAPINIYGLSKELSEHREYLSQSQRPPLLSLSLSTLSLLVSLPLRVQRTRGGRNTRCISCCARSRARQRAEYLKLRLK